MNETRRGILVLLGAILIHITLGVLYCFGNFSTYIVSYLRFRTGYSTIRFPNTQWLLTLMVCGQGSTMWIGGLLVRKIGARLTILLGCCLLTATTALSYWAISSFYALIITYGIVFGFAIGIAYSPAMTLAMRWLPTYKGVVAGCVVFGFGLGAMVFNPIITIFINPDNISPSFVADPTHPKEKYFHDPEDSAILDRVPHCFLVMAAFFLGLQGIGNLLLKEPPTQFSDYHEESDEPRSVQHESSDNLLTGEHTGGSPDMKPTEILRSRDFWILWFAFFCNNQGIAYASTYWKVFGQGFINDDIFLAAVGSASSIANATSRIVWGGLGDRFGYKLVMCCLQALFGALYILMTYTETGKWGYTLFVCSLFFCVGGSFSLLPAATIRTFGVTHGAANYGLVFTSAVAGSLVNLLIVNLTRGLSSHQVQLIMAVFCFAGCASTFFFKWRGCPCIKRREELDYEQVPQENGLRKER